MDRPNTPSVSAADRAKIGALSSRPKEADYQPLPPPQIRGKVYDATMQEAIERVNPDEFMDHGSEGFKKKIGFPITIPGLQIGRAHV